MLSMFWDRLYDFVIFGLALVIFGFGFYSVISHAKDVTDLEKKWQEHFWARTTRFFSNFAIITVLIILLLVLVYLRS